MHFLHLATTLLKYEEFTRDLEYDERVEETAVVNCCYIGFSFAWIITKMV